MKSKLQFLNIILLLVFFTEPLVAQSIKMNGEWQGSLMQEGKVAPFTMILKL